MHFFLLVETRNRRILSGSAFLRFSIGAKLFCLYRILFYAQVMIVKGEKAVSGYVLGNIDDQQHMCAERNKLSLKLNLVIDVSTKSKNSCERFI